MRLSTHKTSNPAFNDYFWDDTFKEKKLSVNGIIIKTVFCLFIIASITVGIWKLHEQGYDVIWFNYGGIIATIVLSVIISYKKQWVAFLVPLYSIAKGCFLGGFSAFIKAKFPELPYQAIGVTIITFFVIFILYQTRIIVVTKKLRSVIITSAVSVFVIYIIAWILDLFGIKTFIWGTSWIAIVFNIIVVIVASLTLLLDFDYIEKYKNKAPKFMEWFAAWGLLVSIVWLYIEILRLMNKLSIRF